MRRASVWILPCLLAMPLAAQTLLQPRPLTAVEKAHRQTRAVRATAKAMDGVVHLRVQFQKAGSEDWVDIERTRSAVIVHESGLALTAWELLRVAFEKAEGEGQPKARGDHRLQVTDRKGHDHSASLLQRSTRNGLALLQIRAAQGVKLRALSLGKASGVEIGEAVVAAALPGTEAGHRVHKGALSGRRDKDPRPEGVGVQCPILLVDASVNAEQCGGAVMDMEGRLIGISHAISPIYTDGEMHSPGGALVGCVIPLEAALSSFKKHFEKVGRDLAKVPVGGSTERGPMPAAYRKAAPSVVYVHGGKEHGSGVVLHASGLVLTSKHVLKGGDKKAKVTLRDGSVVEASVLKTHSGTNMALLKLELEAGTKVQPIALANSKQLKLGESVIAIGRPAIGSVLANVGVLSAMNRDARVGLTFRKSKGLLQTDVFIHQINTGGPLVDRHGHMVGVNNAGESLQALMNQAKNEDNVSPDKKAERQSGIRFAVPVHQILEVFEDELSDNGAGELSMPETTDAEKAKRATRISRIVDRVGPCLISVYVKKIKAQKQAFNPFAKPEDKFEFLGQGSGAIIDASGLALTNWHVVKAAVNPDASAKEGFAVEVALMSGERVPARVLSTSRDDDLALLKLAVGDKKLAAIELGDSGGLAPGESVIAIGNPYGFANTVTSGIITAKERAIRISGRVRKFHGLLQTDAAINPGNSGGALLDLNGMLIGINSAGNVMHGKVGFAIPVDHVRSVFRSRLLAMEKLRTVYIGMQVGNQKGEAVVVTVVPGGPAARAGFATGDRILSLGGTKVDSRLDFAKRLLQLSADKEVVVELQRKDKKSEVKLVPASHLVRRILKSIDLEVAEVGAHDAPQLVKAASVAMHRKYTGAQDEPSEHLDSALKVIAVYAGGKVGKNVKTGDLFLGVNVVQRDLSVTSTRLISCSTLAATDAALRSLTPDTDATHEAWFCRDGKVFTVPMRLRRVR